MIASSDFLLRGRPGLRRTSPATSLELPFMSCSEHRNDSRPNYLTALGLSASDRTLRCAGSDHAVPSLGALQYCGYLIHAKWPATLARARLNYGEMSTEIAARAPKAPPQRPTK